VSARFFKSKNVLVKLDGFVEVIHAVASVQKLPTLIGRRIRDGSASASAWKQSDNLLWHMQHEIVRPPSYFISGFGFKFEAATLCSCHMQLRLICLLTLFACTAPSFGASAKVISVFAQLSW